MVFSSVPVYLDPPNWHHQHLNQGTGGENPQHLPHLPSAAAHHHVVGGGGGGSIIRPEEGSMAADRARLGNNNKVVQPEVPLKCPRCDSTNTKFCYFNNYSLSQPRHFCKTCRRYWTRGGALRNVPVGGGCRRNNKKSKSSSSSSSKSSSANNGEKQPQIGNYNYSNSTSTLNTPSHVIGHPQQRQASAHQLPLMATLHNLSQYSNTGTHNNTGFNFVGGGNHRTDHVDFHIGSSTNSSISSSSLLGFHQFPFFEAPIRTAGLYSFQNQNNVTEDPSSSLVMAASNSRVSDEHRRQGAPVKMEDQQPQLQQQGINFTRQLLGISENQFDWGAAAGNNNWTDLSEGLDHNPSSSTIPHHLL